MSIDCCKSYVGQQIIGLLPGGAEECLYVLAINAQDFGASDFFGWTLNGNDFITELANYGTVLKYQNDTGNYSVYVYYTGTEPTDLNVSTPGGDILFTIRKVTDFEGGSCDLVCYQASFAYGYEYRYIDYFAAGAASPRLYGFGQPIDEISLYNQLAVFLGPQITISTVWDGSQYVVTINNAFNLGGFQLGDGAPVYTAFTALPCEIMPPTPVPLALLDAYGGAGAAYSVRKLSSSYTGAALRVRRSSDNAEQDIGFVGLDLDTTALTSFVGAGNGFVTKWYDQSGNNNDGINTIANDQPRIINGGTIDIVNSLPCINFISVDKFNLSSPISTLNINYSAFTVGRRPNNTNNRLIYLGTSDGSFAPYISMHFNDGKIYLANRSKYANYTDTDLNQVQLSSFSISNNLSAYKNSILKTLTVTNFATSGNFNTIGQSGGVSGWNSIGQIQEIILYISDKSSDRIGIETNINNYFNIYP